jgi:DNA-binding NarL/FixJ family response regulator
MTVDPRPTVFVVEDHDIVRLGIERLLEDRFRLVGSADEVMTAVELINERDPDVVLLDVGIPGGGAVAVVNALRRSHPVMKFLAFSVSTARHDVLRLLRAGANGYVVKTTDRQELIESLDRVLSGGTPISPEVAAYLLDIDDVAQGDSRFARLTDREREVAKYIARGYSYREAADAMAISVKTFETHIHHIFAKLGVKSRHQLVDVAVQEGFIRPDAAITGRPTGTVTFLLTDIVGSSKLWEQHPVAMPLAVARHDGLLADSIAAENGWVVKGTGDGVMAVFQRVAWAVKAAVAARDALGREEVPEIGHLGMRLVIATGETDERDGDYFGPVLNNAARLLEVCSAGQILATGVTRAVAGDALTGTTWRKVAIDTRRAPEIAGAYELIRFGV